MAAPAASPTVIVYDGECPFCSAYVALVSLREAVGPVELVDARVSPAWRRRLAERGIDLNDAFVVVQGERIHVGPQALAFIAAASPRRRLADRLNWRLFHNPAAARAAYPVLRAGRNLALRLLGRGPIPPC